MNDSEEPKDLPLDASMMIELLYFSRRGYRQNTIAQYACGDIITGWTYLTRTLCSLMTVLEELWHPQQETEVNTVKITAITWLLLRRLHMLKISSILLRKSPWLKLVCCWWIFHRLYLLRHFLLHILSFSLDMITWGSSPIFFIFPFAKKTSRITNN